MPILKHNMSIELDMYVSNNYWVNGRYLLFIRRTSDKCEKNVRYLLMIQHQILFLNLLNKCQMKSDDESSDVF